MQVGDLVRDKVFKERTGIIVADFGMGTFDSTRTRLFKVLWTRLSPTLPTLVGPAWRTDLEVINESR